MEKDKIEEGFKSSALWISNYPKDDWSYYYHAWFCMKSFLKTGDRNLLIQSEKHFQLAEKLYGGDPLFYLRHSELRFLEARVLNQTLKQKEAIQLLRKASEKDPNHYYYYSLLFEELMKIKAGQVYGSKGNQDYLENVLYALKNYLRLKKFYKERYLKMLKSKLGIIYSYKIIQDLKKSGLIKQ